MPRGDGTGPAGLGSMTGRGLGYCAGYSQPGYITAPGPGMGMGYGRGYGRGRGRGYGMGLAWRRGFGGGGWRAWAPVAPIAPVVPIQRQFTPMNQLEMLKQEKDYLESELKEIQSALQDISTNIEKLEKQE